MIGVTCIFIACKFEEVHPIRLKLIEEKIAHKALTGDMIITMESEILKTLNFNLLGSSPYSISMETLTFLGY